VAATREVTCQLVAGDGQVLDEMSAAEGSLAANGVGDDKTVTLMGFDVLVGGDYVIRCHAFSGAAGDVDAFQGSIAMIPAVFGDVP
jgi:hypothetical protein